MSRPVMSRRVDDLPNAVALAVAKVVRETFSRSTHALQGKEMGLGEIPYVDVIAHAGVVAGGIVVAKHRDALAFLFGSALAFAEPVNINTADAPTLAAAIKGVGVKKAEAIVEYRKVHGPFKSVDELALVDGVGKKTVENSRDNLTIK